MSFDICIIIQPLPRWLSGKEFTCQCRIHRFDPWVRNMPQNRKWQPLPVCLPGHSIDRGAWWTTVYGAAELDTTEHTCTHIVIQPLPQSRPRTVLSPNKQKLPLTVPQPYPIVLHFPECYINGIIFRLSFCLAFTYHSAFEIYPYCYMNQQFIFLLLISITLYVCTTFCLFIFQLRDFWVVSCFGQL